MQHLFNQASISERESLARLLSLDTPLNNYHHKFTKINGTDCFDSVSILLKEGSVTNILISEIKLRKMRHNKYPDYLLESQKMNALLNQERLFKELYKCDNTRILYINQFSDDIYLIWDLKKIDLEKFKTNQDFNYRSVISDDDKVSKSVYMLPVELALKIDIAKYV